MRDTRIDGFKISMKNGILHIDDWGWSGHLAVEKFAQTMPDNEAWDKFWDRWIERRNKAREKAINAYLL